MLPFDKTHPLIVTINPRVTILSPPQLSASSSKKLIPSEGPPPLRLGSSFTKKLKPVEESPPRPVELPRSPRPKMSGTPRRNTHSSPQLRKWEKSGRCIGQAGRSRCLNPRNCPHHRDEHNQNVGPYKRGTTGDNDFDNEEDESDNKGDYRMSGVLPHAADANIGVQERHGVTARNHHNVEPDGPDRHRRNRNSGGQRAGQHEVSEFNQNTMPSPTPPPRLGQQSRRTSTYNIRNTGHYNAGRNQQQGEYTEPHAAGNPFREQRASSVPSRTFWQPGPQIQPLVEGDNAEELRQAEPQNQQPMGVYNAEDYRQAVMARERARAERREAEEQYEAEFRTSPPPYGADGELLQNRRASQNNGRRCNTNAQNINPGNERNPPVGQARTLECDPTTRTVAAAGARGLATATQPTIQRPVPAKLAAQPRTSRSGLASNTNTCDVAADQARNTPSNPRRASNANARAVAANQACSSPNVQSGLGPSLLDFHVRLEDGEMIEDLG